MQIRNLAIASVSCVMMAACSPPAQDSAQPGADSGAPSASMNAMEPGQYRTTITMVEMNMPGVPASAMQNMNMQPVTTEDCVTATDIAEFANNGTEVEEGVTCTQNSMNTAGGRIAGQSTCQGPTGTRTMTMTGTYTSTHVEMEVASATPMPNGAGDMTQRMRMVSERIGACPAGAETAQ